MTRPERQPAPPHPSWLEVRCPRGLPASARFIAGARGASCPLSCVTPNNALQLPVAPGSATGCTIIRARS
jgi:hypothetical protein